MKAMILAAGRGQRMQALTKDTPKVLQKINGKALIEYHIENLVQAGITEIVINTFYLADKIKAFLGNGQQYGAKIEYSDEPELLGMGGGVYQALPLLGKQPFIGISGDMWTKYDFKNLPTLSNELAHLVLTDNPDFHPEGDFRLEDNQVLPSGENNLNYAGFGVFAPELFQEYGPGCYGIDKVIVPAIKAKKVSGEYFTGEWANINTAEQLESIREQHEIR
jgi:MurNAc alpha-1-phosphate uridylyltransferase